MTGWEILDRGYGYPEAQESTSAQDLSVPTDEQLRTACEIIKLAAPTSSNGFKRGG